ncbi:PHD finger protein 20-like isoform X1 [Vanessa tameamea]|uniref:PHD finger protein 20-like isoform X1 n=2 Tax=Vanessa tameamea TaxID=334116 RepID=A0ABM4AZW6_VANTA
MAVKKCCVENCNSSSTRREDIGVTYHKFPKDKILREKWVLVTHYMHTNTAHSTYVCSRHFCKSDFQIYQDSRYVLKSDAVPSIFSWTMTDFKTDKNMETPSPTKDVDEKLNLSSSSKESEGENVEAIKKYIEDQEKEIKDREGQKDFDKALEKIEAAQNDDIINQMEVIEQGDPIVIATSVMDMILSESEAKIANNKDIKTLTKHSLSPKEKGNSSMALSVGSKVEVKDFGDIWYAAEIVEVDYDEMEVLVHYNTVSTKHDEWINVSSPRLRPMTTNTSPIPSISSAVQDPTPADVSETFKDEVKQEDKTKIEFVVGERCLARWRDNRRFIATISNDLGNGHYEVIFDDGFQWKCSTSRLYKLKSTSGRAGSSECLTIDTSVSSTASTPSPTLAGAGPTVASSPSAHATFPIFHTHLFDPTRDYLGSKSERREMKRKLNIKEIFNIGQKKQRKKTKIPEEKVDTKIVSEKKPKVLKSTIKPKPIEELKLDVKMDIPDAVASIIGTVAKEDVSEPIITDEKTETVTTQSPETKPEDVKEEQEIKVNKDEPVDIGTVGSNSDLVVPRDLGLESNEYVEPVIDEEVKLEKFEKPDDSKQEVIEKMKVVINKLEDGLHQMEKVDSPKPVVKLEPVIEMKPVNEVDTKADMDKEKSKKLSKIKKNKKLRLLQEKKVKKQVEKVKSELEEMKRQVEEMRKQMLLKTEELATPTRPLEMPESFLLPGEWCCKWINGQPAGTVSEIEAEVKDASKVPLPRRSVQVEDKRLPPGWTKHMVRRSLGQSAGKWDVVLVGPDNRRFHTKTDMRAFLEHTSDESLKPYEFALLDFGVHLKLSRRMGWVSNTDEGLMPATGVNSLSPLLKKKKISHKRKEKKERKRKKQKIFSVDAPSTSSQALLDLSEAATDVSFENPPLEDGYVYVGSLKVQIIDNLLRCPAENCFKNFRNNTLLQMHIKHYHRELRKMLGATPKVLDLARERTKPTDIEIPKPRHEPESKIIKVKLPRLPRRIEEAKVEIKPKKEETLAELHIDIPVAAPTKTNSPVPRSQDSPKLRQALANKPVKRPKVLLPVRRPDPEPDIEKETEVPNLDYDEAVIDTEFERPVECLDFESEISTHTVTKPFDDDIRKKLDNKRKCFSTVSRRPMSEEDEWYGVNSDMETRSSFPGSGTPDSKTMDKTITQQAVSSESNNEDQKETNMYMYTESGERIKIEHMKREEIINCHCGFREEDGLMVQCELCLCWQHALCHNIQKESEVPEKYTCSICLNPRRGRRSKRFLHDQDRLYEGLLPGAKPCESLRRSHELSGNLLRIQDALHALRVKYYVATKKDHPKLYLWAKDWENTEVTFTQERLNSDYTDLNIMLNNIGKENLPVKPEEVKDGHLDMRTPIIEDPDQDRFIQNTSNSLLNLTTTLSSPSGGPSLDLPITTSELERLAKSVQEQEVPRNVIVPQPEAAIENSACRERLLRHVQRCQALIDARLDSFEAQVAELESQDPSFEDDETADYFPRTKQTIQMLMRDLDTMEELGIIT